MPLIKANFSVPVSTEKEINIKSSLGKAISLFPGKNETYLMVEISSNCHLYLGGKNDSPLALFEVSLLGSCTKEDCQKVTQALCDIAKKELDIDADHVYVTFMEYSKWGYNNFMF